MATVVALHPGMRAPAPGHGTRPQLEHAKLQLHDPKPGGSGKDALGAEREAIKFQFNPKELSLTKSAKWERKPARGASTAGPVEFAGAEPSKLSLEMFFDEAETRDGSVVGNVERLLGCCIPTEESRGQKRACPPLVVFHWGQIVGFPAFVTQVSAKYTLFDSEGTPLRATCSVSLEELAGDLEGQNPTSGALATRRRHTVVAGDSLASVAWREYGDPGMWRALAEYNGIDDPMRLRVGAELLVPAPEDLLPGGR
ncbi:LysM peptidoglycan-binding domain-containing protein [Geodermatophilus sp. SYSU D00703]